MAAEKKTGHPEGWPGLPFDEPRRGRTLGEVYSPLDAEAARWLGETPGWITKHIKDARRRSSALKVAPQLYRYREHNQLTEDGRRFVSPRPNDVGREAGVGAHTVERVLDDLSGGATGQPAPLEMVKKGKRGFFTCYAFNAPETFTEGNPIPSLNSGDKARNIPSQNSGDMADKPEAVSQPELGQNALFPSQNSQKPSQNSGDVAPSSSLSTPGGGSSTQPAPRLDCSQVESKDCQVVESDATDGADLYEDEDEELPYYSTEGDRGWSK